MRKLLPLLLAVLSLVARGTRLVVVELPRTRPVLAALVTAGLVGLAALLAWRFGHRPRLGLR